MPSPDEGLTEGAEGWRDEIGLFEGGRPAVRETNGRTGAGGDGRRVRKLVMEDCGMCSQRPEGVCVLETPPWKEAHGEK